MQRFLFNPKASSSGEQRKTDAKKHGRDFYAGLDEEDEAGKGKRKTFLELGG